MTKWIDTYILLLRFDSNFTIRIWKENVSTSKDLPGNHYPSPGNQLANHSQTVRSGTMGFQPTPSPGFILFYLLKKFTQKKENSV